MTPALLNIIFLIVAAAVGYGVGLLDRRVTAGAKEKKQEKEEILAYEKVTAQLAAEQSRVEQLTRQLSEQQQALSELSALQEAAPKNEHTALQVLVGPDMRWFVEVDGQRVSPEALSAEQRQRLVAIIVQVRPWIDAKAAPPPVAAARPAPPVRPAPPAPAAPPQPGAPRINPLRGFRSMMENDAKKKEVVPALSIIALIDEILQYKLLSSPLAGKAIKLEEGPAGEVLVHVGPDRYPGLDSVPDPQIQAIIREAIAEFNQRQ
ncbi:MAG: hypothetical protein RBS68_04395 [Anaerolineales bacterium]|jgi:hypothetical protein|nr:hypothetical protein [Anaerolineales bacterium]